MSKYTGFRITQYKVYIEIFNKGMKISVGIHKETDYTGVGWNRVHCKLCLYLHVGCSYIFSLVTFIKGWTSEYPSVSKLPVKHDTC